MYVSAQTLLVGDSYPSANDGTRRITVADGKVVRVSGAVDVDTTRAAQPRKTNDS